MTADRFVGTRCIHAAVKGRETEVLDELDIPWREGNPHIPCPYPDHADNNPSWRWDQRKARAFCTCSAHSILDVVAKVEGVDFDRAKIRAAELLKQAAGFDMLMIPYSGTGDVNVALLRGDVDIAVGALAAVLPLLQQKDVKALAVTSAKRSFALPNVPSMGETVPGYDLSVWFAIAAAAGTPRPIVEKIRAAVHGALSEPGVIEALARDGAEIATSTPEELGAIIEADYAKFGALIKSLNLKE
jgi:hypothetical protein